MTIWWEWFSVISAFSIMLSIYSSVVTHGNIKVIFQWLQTWVCSLILNATTWFFWECQTGFHDIRWILLFKKRSLYTCRSDLPALGCRTSIMWCHYWPESGHRTQISCLTRDCILLGNSSSIECCRGDVIFFKPMWTLASPWSPSFRACGIFFIGFWITEGLWYLQVLISKMMFTN